jgi:hypothetical protein
LASQAVTTLSPSLETFSTDFEFRIYFAYYLRELSEEWRP